jgi:ferredoxin-type protein NapG
MTNEQDDPEGPGSGRRSFLLSTVKSLGLAGIGGVLWGGHVATSKASPPVLRPPAALPEEQFEAKCIKCGLCVEACPYDALVLAAPGDRRPIGTPYFLPREKPCRMCRDVPCTAVCPTGALDPALVEERDASGAGRSEINRARMGLAVIDRETCIAYWGIQCDACYRACPLLDKAITIDYARNDRTGKHAFMAPLVHSDACTGCGMCEHACVTKKAAIFVLPREIAMGKSDVRYIKGWDTRDEQRMKDIPTDTTTMTKRSEKAPLDYLNEQDMKTSE